MSDRRSTPTSFLRDLKPRHSVHLPAVLKTSPENLEDRPEIFLHLCWDKSGSFQRYETAISELLEQFSRRCADHGIADNLQIAVTEMAGIAVSAPYKPIGSFAPPNLTAGGGSPHAQFLAAARKVDAPLIGAPKSALIRLIACDGESTDCETQLEHELIWLENAQREDPAFHAFVLKMGPSRREDVLRRMSPLRPNFDAFNGNFDVLLNQIFQLVAGTVEDPTVPARSMNLREIARPQFREDSE